MRMADIMQIPPLLAIKQEKERLAVLQAAASLPPKYNSYPDNKVTVADVFDALQVFRMKNVENIHILKSLNPTRGNSFVFFTIPRIIQD